MTASRTHHNTEILWSAVYNWCWSVRAAVVDLHAVRDDLKTGRLLETACKDWLIIRQGL